MIRNGSAKDVRAKISRTGSQGGNGRVLRICRRAARALGDLIGIPCLRKSNYELLLDRGIWLACSNGRETEEGTAFSAVLFLTLIKLIIVKILLVCLFSLSTKWLEWVDVSVKDD